MSMLTTPFYFWTNISDHQPSTVYQQTVWPTCPPSDEAVHRPSDTGGRVVVPYFYYTLNQTPHANDFNYRKSFLERSVFDLVADHSYLALTDPQLLGWYLSLSPEDRKLIQGEGGFHQFLLSHPALELSPYHVYVKYNAGNTGCAHCVQPVVGFNSHTSRVQGAKACRCGMPHTHDLEMFNNGMEPLTLLDCYNCRDTSERHPSIREDIYCPKQPPHLHDNLQPTKQEPNHDRAHRVTQFSQLSEEKPLLPLDGSESAAAVCKDPAARASFSVDVELQRRGGKPELPTHKKSANFTSAALGPLHCFRALKERLRMKSNMELVCSLLDRSGWLTVERECPSEDAADDTEADMRFKNQSDSFQSIMEDDASILVCLPSEDVKAHHSGLVITGNEAVTASSESVMKVITTEKCSSPMPCVTTCDVKVGTEDPGTSDKHVNTEVHMADLDYLAEEFIKLRVARKEVREQKEKRKSLGCKSVEECGCFQRAQRAELCLLALQYNMCRQHCWRLYYTSAEGGQLAPLQTLKKDRYLQQMQQFGDTDALQRQRSQNPAANIVSVLQKLESDYNEMRDQILAGLPLEQLQLLSVDCEKLTSGTSYIPALIIGDVLGNIPSQSSQEPQKHDTSSEEKENPKTQSRNGCQQSQREEQIKKSSKAGRAVSFVPQHRETAHDADKPEGKQTSSCKEANTSEAWYDAEEDLESVGPAGAADPGQEPTVTTTAGTSESAGEQTEGSVLWVSNLPSNVTESDVMLCFKKSQASEVSISALKNGLGVAAVITSGPQSAEAAVRELNGCSMQGHTLHVEHVNRATGGDLRQASASVSDPEYSQDTTHPQTSETECSSTGSKLITQPPLCSSIKVRKVVSIYPTAKGTCVPQHFGTMESFDTLMAELTQRHPDIGRQRIVDALIELKAKHRGALSSLPLKTISEMISELLTTNTSATLSPGSCAQRFKT